MTTRGRFLAERYSKDGVIEKISVFVTVLTPDTLWLDDTVYIKLSDGCAYVSIGRDGDRNQVKPPVLAPGRQSLTSRRRRRREIRSSGPFWR